MSTVAIAPPAAVADEHVVVVGSDFEDGTTQGWAPRADETVTADAAAARTGGFGLAVADRTRTWEGPTLDLLDTMEFGVTYTFSAWVRLAPGEPTGQLRISVERRWQDQQSFDQVVGNTTVTAGGWVRLQGSYALANDADFLTVYVESADGTAAFQLDDFELSTVPLPPRVRAAGPEAGAGAVLPGRCGDRPPADHRPAQRAAGQAFQLGDARQPAEVWPGGFQGAVTITNPGTAPIDGWELAWSFPDGQQISQLWNGAHQQTGPAVTVTNAAWNGAIPAGSSVGFGFLAGWTGSNSAPTGFALNGTACALS